MLDIKLIREDPEPFRKALARRGLAERVDELLAADERRRELTQRVEITSHNHGFAVDPDSLNPSECEITHINLNDQTLEGFRSRNHPVFCVQYHPEAAPGPHDSHYLFDDFTKLMREAK